MPRKHFEFGPFHLDPAEYLLTRGAELVQLPPKAFETLLLLVENNGHVIQKSALMETLWPDSFVEESNLTQNIFLVRKALGENQEQQYVQTISRVGYRFIMPVREVFEDADSLVVETHSRERIVIRERIVEELGETDSLPVPNASIKLVTSNLSWPQIGLITAVLTILAVGFGAFLLYHANTQRKLRSERIANIRSLAVVPFENLDAESADRLLGFGIAEALTTRLGRFDLISIRPAGALREYANSENDPALIGRELSVDAVLCGQVQKTAGHLRVSARLLSVRDGAVLWSEVFDDDYAHIFSLQDKLAERLAGEIAEAKGEHPRTLLASRRPQNVDAYEAYLKGRYYWNRRTAEGGRKAAEYFKESVEIDPNFALGYAGLADVHMLFAVQAAEILNTMPPFEVLVAKAIELDGSLAEPHAALAYHKGAVEWDWSGAEREFERAIALNPNDVTARHWHAYNLISMGHCAEAIAEIERARRIDPVSLIINTDVGHINYLARRYDRALKVLEETVALDPDFAIAHERLGEVYAARGRYEAAIVQFQRARILFKGSMGEIDARLGYVYAVSGKRNLAEEELNELAHQDHGKRAYDQASLALILSGLREKEPAFEALYKAVAHPGGLMTLYKVDPMFDNLRTDPRNNDLLGRMNLSSTLVARLQKTVSGAN